MLVVGPVGTYAPVDIRKVMVAKQQGYLCGTLALGGQDLPKRLQRLRRSDALMGVGVEVIAEEDDVGTSV